MTFHIQINVYMMNIVDSWHLGGGYIHVSIPKNQISDIEITNAHSGSSGYFGSKDM